MERQKDEKTLSELSSQIVTMMTTEHYNLQSGRSMTVADTNGCCTLFIGTVSGALIAIAFTGQASRMGTAFFLFSLVLFPSLFFMGLFTFQLMMLADSHYLMWGQTHSGGRSSSRRLA